MFAKTVIYTVNGMDIHASEAGNPDRPLALLIHGWSSSRYALSPLFDQVKDRHFTVAVDLPGYGNSPAPAQRLTIPFYADLLADLIRQISPKRPAVLIGHSMGGMISITLAQRHPQVVERMILVCPTISGNLSTFIKLMVSPLTMVERFRLGNWLVAALEPLFGITDAIMRPASFADRTDISEEDYQQLRRDARRPGQGRVRAECYWAMRDNDLRQHLGGIEQPTLVVWGMEDNTVPLRDASVIAEKWPEADLRIIPNAGHWPQFETAALTRRYVRSFLNTPAKLLKLDL